MKHFTILIAFNVIISTIYTILSNFTTYAFLNSTFLIGMLYFLAGSFCFVYEKGFFNVTIFAFNKVFQEIARRRGVLCEEPDVDIEDYINRKNKFFLTYNLLASGFLISVSSMLISFIVVS